MSNARMLLEKERGSTGGFELLCRCFDRYKTLIANPHLTLLLATIMRIPSFRDQTLATNSSFFGA